MKKAVIYIHGKGGTSEEAKHYVPLFPEWDVIGFDYQSETPWEAKTEFSAFFAQIKQNYDAVSILANSIGAYFGMSALDGTEIQTAYFISPVVDMVTLITQMMAWAGVTEEELESKKEIKTAFGETLSWEYLCYVRSNPIQWKAPTYILYGSRDDLTSFAVISEFAEKSGATLTVMENGEHWFHTEEQMAFLDSWLRTVQSGK